MATALGSSRVGLQCWAAGLGGRAGRHRLQCWAAGQDCRAGQQGWVARRGGRAGFQGAQRLWHDAVVLCIRMGCRVGAAGLKAGWGSRAGLFYTAAAQPHCPLVVTAR